MQFLKDLPIKFLFRLGQICRCVYKLMSCPANRNEAGLGSVTVVIQLVKIRLPRKDPKDAVPPSQALSRVTCVQSTPYTSCLSPTRSLFYLANIASHRK